MEADKFLKVLRITCIFLFLFLVMISMYEDDIRTAVEDRKKLPTSPQTSSEGDSTAAAYVLDDFPESKSRRPRRKKSRSVSIYKRGPSVSGYVANYHGMRLKGMQVEAVQMGRRKAARTGCKGYFKIKGLSSRQPVTLYFKGKGYKSRIATIGTRVRSRTPKKFRVQKLARIIISTRLKSAKVATVHQVGTTKRVPLTGKTEFMVQPGWAKVELRASNDRLLKTRLLTLKDGEVRRVGL